MTRNFDVKTKNVKLFPAECVVLNHIFPYHAKVILNETSLTLEHQKDHKLSAKHIVEEAMTAALVQKCNKCAKPFIKESGCNKMTCSCGNLQCYVCGQSIKDYHHFERPGKDGKKCPLHEQNDTRLETKIKNAQADAVKKVLDEGEGLNEEDIKVEIPQVEPPRGHHAFQHHNGFLPVGIANVQPWNRNPPAIPPVWGFGFQVGLPSMYLKSRTFNQETLLHNFQSVLKFLTCILKP